MQFKKDMGLEQALEMADSQINEHSTDDNTAEMLKILVAEIERLKNEK